MRKNSCACMRYLWYKRIICSSFTMHWNLNERKEWKSIDLVCVMVWESVDFPKWNEANVTISKKRNSEKHIRKPKIKRCSTNEVFVVIEYIRGLDMFIILIEKKNEITKKEQNRRGNRQKPNATKICGSYMSTCMSWGREVSFVFYSFRTVETITYRKEAK